LQHTTKEALESEAVCGPEAIEQKAIVIDRFFDTQQKAIA